MVNTLYKIGLGGGCHWCTEAVFLSLKGVKNVQQGWIASVTPHESFSEAVIVEFDSAIISVQDLIAIHLHTHKATSNHSMREKYRSAIYYFSTEDEKLLKSILKKLQNDFDTELIIKILPYKDFKPSLEEHQNYYYKNPNKPFCEVYIKPKLSFLLKNYNDSVRKDKV